jgi:hypothetical protein
MNEQPVRRRRRRRGHSRAGREATSWLTLIILGAKKSYHWVLLTILVLLIILSGFIETTFT